MRPTHRSSFASLVLLLGLVATADLVAQTVQWVPFRGPVGDRWTRMGTDGTDLYVTTAGNQLWRWTFDPRIPSQGLWTRLTDCPRQINGWDSYRGLAHQGGYLYTSALANTQFRTIVRYDIANDSWEIWGNPTGTGSDLNICNTSGNAMFMDPTQSGVGYSAWHGGNWWVTFDWNAQTANNNWMSTSGLPVADPQWVSRCEDVVVDAQGTYYATKNDWGAGLTSGDCIYSFDLATMSPTLVAQKPWQAGAGQTLELVPAGHVLSATGNDELWLFRGGDGMVASQEGWSNAGTQEMSILDLSTQQWLNLPTPFFTGYGTDSVMIGNYLFVKSCGDASDPDVHDDDYWVMVSGATWNQYGDGCPGTGGNEPFISAIGGPPTLGNGSFAIGVSNGLGGALAILAAGGSDSTHLGNTLPLDLSSFGVSGCFLNTSIDQTYLHFLSGTGAGGGTASQSLPIPGGTSFLGVDYHAQWFVFDGGAPNRVGIATSRGGRLEIDL